MKFWDKKKRNVFFGKRSFFAYCLGFPDRIDPGGMKMYADEKKPVPWEAGDPKLPVVKSGRAEKRRAY